MGYLDSLQTPKTLQYSTVTTVKRECITAAVARAYKGRVALHTGLTGLLLVAARGPSLGPQLDIDRVSASDQHGYSWCCDGPPDLCDRWCWLHR